MKKENCLLCIMERTLILQTFAPDLLNGKILGKWKDCKNGRNVRGRFLAGLLIERRRRWITSALVEISSELVRISSELVRTISELLIISAFKKITNSASGTPSLWKNQCIRASVISPLFTFRPVVFKLFTKGYTGKTSAECRCGKADCASWGRAWSCGCRKRLFRAKKLRNSNFTKREVSIFCKMTPKACSII